MNVVRDYFDVEIKVGDLIIYPTYIGSTAFMNSGTIQKFVEIDHPYTPGKVEIKAKVINRTRKPYGIFSGPERAATFKSFKRCVVLEREDGTVPHRP